MKQFSSKDRIFPDDHFDMIYCAGLFDYLSDKVCTRFIDLCFRWSQKNSLILFTNVHPVNPGINIMEYVLEWHLIYRNEKQMLDLFNRSEDKKVYTDDTGFNVFLEIEKV